MDLRSTMSAPNTSFPSIGEALKFLFDVSGLLAQKHGQSEKLTDEKLKKSIQKKLARLAKDEGDLDKSISELIKDFSCLLMEAVQNPAVVEVSLQTAADIHEAYQNTLKQEGTYLSKEDTTKWMLDCWLPDLFIQSAHRHSLMASLENEGLSYPANNDWWLPHFGERTITPLEKAWHWIYERANTTQTRFHNPDGNVTQNSEVVSRWFRRNRLPTWSELQNKLHTSVELLTNCSNEKYQREVTPELINSFRVVLFFARMSTDTFRRITSAYGIDYAKKLTQQIRAQNRRLTKFHRKVKTYIEARFANVVFKNEEHARRVWHDEASAFWSNYSAKLKRDSQVMQTMECFQTEERLSITDAKKLLTQFDSFFISMTLRQKRYAPDNSQLIFLKLYMQGLELQKCRDFKASELEKYQALVAENGFDDELRWLVEWLLATYCSRSDDHNAAYEHYKRAFELSKHRIGKESYLLVNEFAEACAKNNKWRDFKKLVSWASHNAIPVRWHRGFDDSEEAIRMAFEMFKYVRY
jgi:hypothetical protein